MSPFAKCIFSDLICICVVNTNKKISWLTFNLESLFSAQKLDWLIKDPGFSSHAFKLIKDGSANSGWISFAFGTAAQTAAVLSTWRSGKNPSILDRRRVGPQIRCKKFHWTLKRILHNAFCLLTLNALILIWVYYLLEVRKHAPTLSGS